ncbi:hypothetical protein TrCOL_g8304 [Triparma columacea]|uniref:Uncharacterized protein n=1 Tax=Triparma columacea TaxID=722753 RepID=A0A9W7GGN7_9STRA|nr:hypothetical protein TrCOL_g8304 [Triparma columacea]
MVNKKQMKIVPQSDPSGGASVHKLHDTNQNIPANEELGENNPSTFSLARAFEGKGTDNEGADNEGDEAAIIEDAAISDGANVPMKAPSSSTVDVKLDVPKVICFYVQGLTEETSVPREKPVCSAALSDLTRADVKTLVGGMLYFLRQEVNELDAVKNFYECYPCMRELSGTVPQFNVMNSCLLKDKFKPKPVPGNGSHNVIKVPRAGTMKDKLRDNAEVISAYIKQLNMQRPVPALLSIGDLITDIIMIVEYFQTRSLWGYAWASLASLLINLTLQALVSFAQNRAKPWQRQLKEQFFVWSLVKPGVDAWRVASGAAQEEGQLVSARYELTANKSVELVAEAIPGTLIQLSALLMSESKPTRSALFSFAFCILTAAFTSAITSWDWDLSKENRKYKRSFYGYIPSNVKGKVKVFASLYFLSAFNLLTRSFACVLFYIKGGILEVATLLGGELLIYFVIKGLRRDLWYWTPIYGGLGVFISWILRWTIKVIVDWTAVVHFRHPNEVGGAYFTFSLGLTIVIGVVAALQYEKVVDDVISSPNSTFLNSTFLEDVELGEDNQIVGGEESGLEESTVVTIMMFACAGMVVSYTTLLVSVKREYLHTFISTKTSNKSIQEEFTKNEEDEQRFRTFEGNRYKWERKIGAEVKVWINERLPLWLEEPPEWFNDQRRSIIPDDFVTDPEILVRLRTNNVKKIIEQRRRSSLGEIFATQTAGGDGEEED